MWFSTVLLLLGLTSVMADVEDDMRECTERVNFENLVEVMNLPEADELNAVCPAMLGFFECFERVIKDHTGFTILELKEFMEDTEVGRFFTVYVNFKNMFVDLCDEDSQLNKDYREHSQCYKSISPATTNEVCERQALAAFETFKDFEDNVQEEANEDASEDNRECMVQAYRVACAAAQIHEECGQEAFDTFMQMMRRTTFFRYGVCTEHQLNIVKTKFFDSLDMESPQEEIYRLAFDLKKRRK